MTTITELGGELDRAGFALQIIPAMRPKRRDPDDPTAGHATVSLWHGGGPEFGEVHVVKRAPTTAEALTEALDAIHAEAIR